MTCQYCYTAPDGIKSCPECSHTESVVNVFQDSVFTVGYIDRDSRGLRIHPVPMLKVDGPCQIDLVDLKRLILTWEEKVLY